MRRKLSQEERDKRNAARWKIIQLANRHRMDVHAYSFYLPKLLGMKDLNRAVHVCRQAMIVSGKLLIEAGFRPHAARPSNPQPTVLRKLFGK